jgi:hypothetical protein
MKVRCGKCANDVEVAGTTLRQHRRTKGGKWCLGGGTLATAHVPFVSDQEHGTRFPRVPSRVQARDEPCADPARCDIHGNTPGNMHEPKPYTGELDWQDLVHPFAD